MVSVKINHFY